MGSRGHIKKWHRKFNEWNKIDANKKEAEELERQRKMQLKSAQDAEDKERRRIMKQEKQRKEREAKAKRDRQKAKEEEARRKELEKRRKLIELEEEKEAEMERQKKKNNHEWDVNCKGNGIKVNEKIVTGSNNGHYERIWTKGIVSNGSNEWKFKIINDYGSVYIGITNEKNEKKKNSSLETLFYYTYGGYLYDADGKETKTNGKAKNNDIVVMKLDLEKNSLTFLLNGKQIGNAMAVKNGSYRAAVSLYYPRDSIELL